MNSSQPDEEQKTLSGLGSSVHVQEAGAVGSGTNDPDSPGLKEIQSPKRVYLVGKYKEYRKLVGVE